MMKKMIHRKNDSANTSFGINMIKNSKEGVIEAKDDSDIKGISGLTSVQVQDAREKGKEGRYVKVICYFEVCLASTTNNDRIH